MDVVEPSPPPAGSERQARCDVVGVTHAFLRFGALIAPQFVLSALVFYLYHRFLYLPSELAWLHLPLIMAVQCVTFALCGFCTRYPWSEHAMASRGYAALLFVKLVAINGIYLASFTTTTLWGANFTLANLGMGLPHLEGLYMAFGSSVPLAVGLIGAMLACIALLLQRVADRLMRHLRWSVAPVGTLRLPSSPGKRGNPRTFGRVPLFVTLMAVLVACLGCWVQVNLTDQLARDPLFSFWLDAQPVGTGEGKVSAAAMADQRTRANYPAVTNFRRKNVIIFIVDCLRSDHLPMFGYPRNTSPFLQSLYLSGQLQGVEESVSIGNDSPQGIIGILASRNADGIRPGTFKIYEALQRQGYRTNAIMGGDKIGYGDLRRLYGTGFDLFYDGTQATGYTVNDDELILDRLERLAPSDGTPSFFLFHLMSVHVIGVQKPAFDIWLPSLSPTQQALGLVGSLERDPHVNTYDNRIRQADDFIQRIWTALKAKGYLDDYIVAITGDHGEGLGERGNQGHSIFLFGEDVRVPILFIDSERQSFGRMPFASQIDVAPTLLARLGLPIPESWEGMSLIDSPGRTTAWISSRRKDQWRALIQREETKSYKYLFFGPLNGKFEEMLFELGSDPGELNNLIGSVPPEKVAEFRRMAADHFNLAPLPSNDSTAGQ